MYRPRPGSRRLCSALRSLDSRGYKDFIPASVRKFDPSLVELFKQAGEVCSSMPSTRRLRMYDSDLSDGRGQDGPHRDVLAELSQPFAEPGCTLVSPHIVRAQLLLREVVIRSMSTIRSMRPFMARHQWLNDRISTGKRMDLRQRCCFKTAGTISRIGRKYSGADVLRRRNGQPATRHMTEFTAFYDNFAVSHRIDA